MAKLIAVLSLFLLFASVFAETLPTLVVVDDLSLKDSHSSLFDSLTNSGHELQFFKASEELPRVLEFGELQFDGLMLFSSENSFQFATGKDDVVVLREALAKGLNMMIVTDDANGDVSDVVRDFALDLGVDFDSDGSAVVDHFHFVSGNPHTRIMTTNVVQGSPITGGKKIESPIVFDGIAATRTQVFNPLLLPILTAKSSAFSMQEAENLDIMEETIASKPFAVGEDVLLVSAVQTRSNSRVTFVGSKYLLSNEAMTTKVSCEQCNKSDVKPGNADFVSNLALWAFGHTGQLRMNYLKHWLNDTEETPEMYTVGEDMYVETSIEEFDFKTKKWIPHVSESIPFVFKMLDPKYRHKLTPPASSQSSIYSTQFKVPDVYGVYTMLVDYHAPGYTHLVSDEQVSVRPLMHDQYERFIPAAYPYYTSVFATMAAFFVFCLVFLYCREKTE